MKLTCAGTGSNGNAYVLEKSGRRLILDMGISWKKGVLQACGYDVHSVDAVLITHEHG